MKIRNKLLLTNGLVFLLFITTLLFLYQGAFFLLSLKDFERESSLTRNRVIEVEFAISELLNSPDGSLYALSKAISNSSIETFIKEAQSINLKEDMDKQIVLIEDLMEKRDLNSFYQRVQNLVFHIKIDLKKQSINDYYQKNRIQKEEIDPLYTTISDLKTTIDEFLKWYSPISFQFQLLTQDIHNEAEKQVKSIIWRLVTLLILSSLISFIVIILIYKNLTMKLDSVAKGVDQIVSGNINTQVSFKGKDEFSTMGEQFNNLTVQVSNKLNNVSHIMEQISQSLGNENTKQLIDIILKLGISSTKAQGGAFFSVENGQIYLKESKGSFILPLKQSQESSKIPEDKNIISLCYKSQEAIFIKKVKDNNLIDPSLGEESMGISSCFIFPLKSENTIHGILCLEKTKPHEFFSDMDFKNFHSFADFCALALANINRLEDILQAKGVSRELEIASTIQKSLLPNKMPRFNFFEPLATLPQSEKINSEIFDIFPLDQNKWLFTSVAISGSGGGIGSSMKLMVIRTLIKILMTPNMSLDTLFKRVEEQYSEKGFDQSDITISFCLMDNKKREAHLLGSPYFTFLIFREGRLKPIRMEEKECQSKKITLKRNEMLLSLPQFIFTKKDLQEQKFNLSILEKLISTHKKESLKWLHQAIRNEISFFYQHQELIPREETIFSLSLKKGYKEI